MGRECEGVSLAEGPFDIGEGSSERTQSRVNVFQKHGHCYVGASQSRLLQVAGRLIQAREDGPQTQNDVDKSRSL